MLHPLATLTSLVQEISRAADAVSAMQTIVQRLEALFDVPVCSLYLRSHKEPKLILAATSGLAEKSVGITSLAINQGLAGTVAHTMHPLNLADGPSHDKFVFMPETGEQPYHQYLGVPLIHLRQLIGVLVIQGTEKVAFSQDQEAFMVTVASQLAATLYDIQQSGTWVRRPYNGGLGQYKKHSGIKGSAGIGCGYLHLVGLKLSLEKIPVETPQGVEAEQLRFKGAVDKLRNELSKGAGRLKDASTGSDIESLFAVYRMMLDSPELQVGIQQRINEGESATQAIQQTALQIASVFESAEDPYLRSRGEDVRNIATKLLGFLLSKGGSKENPQEEVILAGELISITDLSEYPPGIVKGIVCTNGSALSHTAIVANALGIPAVMGASSLHPAQLEGEFVIVDGYRGECITHPLAAMIREYRRLQNADSQFSETLQGLREQPAETTDGFRVKLFTNTGLLADVTPGLKNGAEGVGLYRSEIPFMIHDSFPTEGEQTQVYRQVLESYHPKPVSMRILDIGGDKQLPYFEIKEDNPYLGWRGIRFMLDNTSLLVTQIRAMLKASEGLDNLKLLVPMVSRIDEIESFFRLTQTALDGLLAEGYNIKRPQIGMMVEVPSAIFLLPRMARYLDFISVGSNDLTQYLLAVDRNNPRVSGRFDNLNPVMLLALQSILQQSQSLGLPVSLCGEMASDPAAVLILIGMGFNQLSLSAHYLPKVKWLIRSVSRTQAKALYQEALTMSNEQDIRTMLNNELQRLGLNKLTGNL